MNIEIDCECKESAVCHVDAWMYGFETETQSDPAWICGIGVLLWIWSDILPPSPHVTVKALLHTHCPAPEVLVSLAVFKKKEKKEK